MNFGYRPALDSVRALAVVVVVLFHAEVAGFGGGFLGVSVFFTLSGYLITSLLIAEHERSGTIDIGAFYARRVRRLAPAALICVALVLAAGGWWSASQRASLPLDAVAALGHVANWRFALSDHSYAELFLGDPSPLAHFWSLAVEEQVYLVVPVVAAVALRRGVLGRVVVVLAGASVLAGVLTADGDLAYQATHTRAVEVLVGAGAALVVARRPMGRRLATVSTAVGLVTLGVGVVVVRIDDRWLTKGGLAAFSMAWALLVVGLSHDHALSRALSWRPLVALGRRSYGVYLFHWPLLLLVGSWPVAVGVACALAALSYRFVEQPVRQRRVLGRGQVLWPSWAAAIVVGMIASMVVVPAPAYTRDEELLQRGDAGPTAVVPVASDASAVVDQPVPVVRVIGSDHLDWFTPRGWWAVGEGAAGPAIAVVVVATVDDLVDVRGVAVGDAVVLLDRAEEAWRGRLERAMAEGVPVLVFDATLPGVEVGLVERVALEAGVEVVHQVSDVRSHLSAMVDDATRPHRVLVLGDSTSIAMAQAISDAGAGRVDVVWAGANGCPVARVSAVRAARDQSWTALDCVPFDESLPALLAEHHPETVVVTVGPTELQEQRLVADGSGFVAGDAEFARVHDSEFDALRALVGSGVELVVTDCPSIRAGRWATTEMADPLRVAAWNEWLAGWATSRGVGLWDVAAAVDEWESGGTTVLVDGVHPGVEPLAEIVGARFLRELVGP